MDPNNYPSNRPGAPVRNPKMPEKKKITPSIERVPEIRKVSNTKKFFNNFIVSDAADVKEYIVSNVLLPRAKTLLLDMIRNTAEMFIMGPSGVSRSRTNYSRTSDGRIVHDYSSSSNNQPSRMTQGSTYVPFPEPLLDSEDEALDIINDMIEYVDEFDCVNISEFLGFCNCPKDDEYTYQHWGWSADVIRRCIAEQIPDGRWVIKLPKPRYIK